MASPTLLLPEPWVLRESVDPDFSDRVEALVGSRLAFEDLDASVDLEQFGAGSYTPRTDRAMRVMGRRWVELENVDTGTVALVRLQHSLGASGVITITSVIYPDQDGRTLSGADLRSLPVAAISAAFTAHEQRGRAQMKILFALGGTASEDPMEKLTAASAHDAFTARVARQFIAFEEDPSTSNTAKAMAAHNDVPLPTVQRWITRARKRGFLPPADPRRVSQGVNDGPPTNPAE